jgi:hypothetical protein
MKKLLKIYQNQKENLRKKLKKRKDPRVMEKK